jgi:hypothetical protein
MVPSDLKRLVRIVAPLITIIIIIIIIILVVTRSRCPYHTLSPFCDFPNGITFRENLLL